MAAASGRAPSSPAAELGLGEQIDGLVAAAAGSEDRLGVAPTAIGGRQREARALPGGGGARPGARVLAAASRDSSASPVADGRTELGGRAEPPSIGIVAEAASRSSQRSIVAPHPSGRRHAGRRAPARRQLQVGRALQSLVDDRRHRAEVAAAPGSLGEAAEQQPVEPPVAQAQRVRPHGLEAVAGALDVAADGSRRAPTASWTIPSSRSGSRLASSASASSQRPSWWQ